MPSFNIMTTTNRTYNPSNIIDTTTGFTDRDEVLVSLHDICKCHLVLDPTQDMVMFNDNCYDRKRFDDLKDFSLKKFNDVMSRGHYRYRKLIRDPRTNQKIWITTIQRRSIITTLYLSLNFKSLLIGVSSIFGLMIWKNPCLPTNVVLLPSLPLLLTWWVCIMQERRW